MPRPAKGARLYWHAAERTWLIRDGSITRRTGCGERDRQRAEERLGAYLSEKFKPAVREGSLVRLSVAEVLTAYAREHVPTTKGSSPASAGYNISTLLQWWTTKKLADVHKSNCQAYTNWRCKKVKPSSPRRELAVLQAAINHWNESHGPLDAVPVVTLPAKAPARDRWLERGEAGLLLAGALGFYRVFWTDVKTRKRHVCWQRYAGAINRHLARFILLGLYTGSRKAVLLDIQWMANTVGGWVDLNKGVLHRKPAGEEETKKRKPPMRLGRKILAHLRRWKAIDDAERSRLAEEAGEPVAALMHVVTWRGCAVASVRTAWEAAVDLAWLDDKVTPHVLRHTRATWVMQAGIDVWEASGSLGMSVQMLQDVYGHHHPDFQKNVAEV